MKRLHTQPSPSYDKSQPRARPECSRAAGAASAKRGVFSTAASPRKPAQAPNVRETRVWRGLACDWNMAARSGRSPWSCQIPGAVRRPLTGAEYTVGRVLVDTYETFTEDSVRKRGLEPPHPCGYMNLNHARLPIPPLPHEKNGARYWLPSTLSRQAQAATDCIESF